MILENQKTSYGPFRYNTIMLFFVIFLILVINDVSSTGIKECNCSDTDVYDTDDGLVDQYQNAYCYSSDSLISSFGLYQDKDECAADTAAFKTEIDINNGEWVFFDSDGNVIPASSNNDPTYCYYKENIYTQVDTNDNYYLNKYKGGLKLYKYSSTTPVFTKTTIEANKAYKSDYKVDSDASDGIIFCKSSNNCKFIADTDIKGYFYINGDDSKSVFVYYDTTFETISISSDLYFVYEMGDLDGLIECPASGTCSIKSIAPKNTANTSGKYVSEGYYLGKGYTVAKDEITEAIIQCTSDYGCKVVYNSEDDLKPKSTEAYFVNAALSKTTNPLIKYDAKGNPLYTEVPATANVYYINNGSESNKPLIYCKSATSCEAVEADESYHYISYSKNLIIYDTEGWSYLDADQSTGYLLNGGIDRYDKPLIYCSDKDNCSAVTAKTDGYYIYNNSNALIYCSTEHSCIILENAEEGYYINNQIDQITNPIIQCSDNDCNPYKLEGPGYYLDQSTFSNNKYYGLIYCSSITSCSQVDFLPGYYSNSNSDSEIIECQTSCSLKTATTCSGSEKTTIYAGSYCYEDSTLNFVYKTIYYNETKTELDENEVKEYLINVSSEESSLANYVYTAVNADVFPGITSSLSTLFKISKSSITQVIEDGMIAINTKTNARMTSYTDGISLGSKLSLYKCQSSSRKCTPVNTCSSEMYIYDSGTQKGLYCNGSNLSSISIAGYYVDGSRTVNGKTPYVLDCNASGICQSLSPSNVYMINSGFDKMTNRLIYCGSDSCSTVVANIGYYLSYDQKGVIQCTSSTKCNYQPVNTFRYYINAGAINSSKIVIQCHSGKCSLINPNPGYYITHTPYVLINCTSRSQCTEVNVSEGHYSSAYKGTATTSYIIHCINLNGNINCGLESTNIGAYVSNNSNILVICDENECNTIEADIGTYISASSSSGSSKIKRNEEGMDMVVPEHNLQKRSSGHGIITCDSEICKELSPAELALIPTCTFSNNKCFISYDYSLTASAVTSVSAGGYCTNADRSKLYFATDSIVVESTVIGSTSSTYLYTTTNTNCIEVSKNYKSFYYTVGSVIYHLDDNRITQVVKNGYYFINVIENTLATGKDIDEYNNGNTKIYKCNGSYCSTIETLKTDSYFADVNKKIIKYTAETQKYSFPYTKDVICIYEDNTCTPKYDMEKRDFCITYLGELALTTTNILSRETAPCFKSKSIDTNIYGFSQNNLYKMNGFSASLVVNTGYHIVTKSTNYTAEYKDYESKPKKIVIYGCVKKNCNIYTPKDKVYYYDSNNKSMYRMVNGNWETPSKSGFAYISVSPIETFIYKFTIKNHEVIIENKVNSGFYYTVDNEMYECTTTSCKTISDSGYVFTNNGEIYYCEWDSEELEDTVCKIQECVNSQYYYIDGYYYRCDTGNRLSIMTSKNCVYSSNYIINFPTILSDDYPAKIRNAVDKIVRNNNSTATTKGGRNYLPVVPAVYTNCTYNFEDKEASFDLVCVKNYVKMNSEDEPEICSVSNMGYIYCSDDSDNPNKCNPSSAFRTLNISMLHIAMTLIIIFFLARF